jgi:glycosyltransferase involved in cell wall biosynthesis
MRLLIVSYYFPPCGGAPVQRWIRLIPHLLKRGFDITVLCAENGDYPFLDYSLLDRVPPEVKVLKAKAPQIRKYWGRFFNKDKSLPYGRIPQGTNMLCRLLIWIRLNLIVPDLRIFWNPSALRSARRELRSSKYDAIISTGPPHSSHLIAMKLKNEFSLIWFADFRDPLSEIHYLKLNPPSQIGRYFYKRIEHRILANADAALVVSPAIAEALARGNKFVVPNGYEPEDFQDHSYRPSSEFRIKYVGQLTAGQDIGIIAKLCKAIKRDFRLTLIGTQIDSRERDMLLACCKTPPDILPFTQHSNAIREMVDAELLLLIVNDYKGNKGMLTTKLFEYLASGSPILCFSPPDSAAAEILSAIQMAKVADYQSIYEAAQWVDALDQNVRNTANIDSYSVENQADRIAQLLESVKSY